MRFLVQRLLHGVAVILGVSVVVFALTWLTGDPTSVLVPLDTPPESVAQIRHQLGLDQSPPLQYAQFLGRAVHGDFGESFRYRSPVLPLVLERLPNTLWLMAASILFALLAALPLGALAASRHGSGLDLAVRTLALFGQSLAPPWLGLVLILLFAVQLHWLPSSGFARPEGVVLPAIVAGLYPAAGLTRLLRARLLDVSRSDYIVTARAKGLQPRLILWRHALRNAILPVITFLGVQVAFLFGNTVVAEAIFAYPGMGRLAVDAIGSRDVPLIQAFVVLSALVVVGVNLLVDVAHVWLDPRLRVSRSGALST